MAPSPVLIAFGSNIDPLNNLQRGLDLLHRLIGIQRVSTVWRSPALDDPERPEAEGKGGDYLNGVTMLHERAANFDPLQLRQCLRQVEHQCGRTRQAWRYAPRTLDLDITLMGSLVFAAEGIILPDPDLLVRPFIALPCAQLAPDLVHPEKKVSLAALAQSLSAHPWDIQPDFEASSRLATFSQGNPGNP
ncbi:MAG: 2-amino-4-hydroxy-6-hydroxymethyldihydropteridine diphosphokinase [Magnetococcales bacterium]|nr:2-amino-4-hydroxy-6-hydroxymethyldihydropteridine diphosphokinase [Magnetococcales bacterium]